jgi:predicted RNase H-like HicB family nuclease
MERLEQIEERVRVGRPRSPEFDGCVAIGKTKEEATELIRSAIAMHLEAMRETALTIPEPVSTVESIEV